MRGVWLVLLASSCAIETRETSLGRQLGTGGGMQQQAPEPELACGAPTVFSPRLFSRIALTPTHLYGVERDGSLVRVPFSGGPEEVLESSAPGRTLSGSLVATSEGLYFGVSDETGKRLTVAFRPFDGGASSDVFVEANTMHASLLASGDGVLVRYVDASVYTPHLAYVRRDAAPTLMEPLQEELSADATDLFFVKSGGIWRQPLAGGDAVKLATRRDVRWLSVIGEHVYFTDGEVPRGVRRLPKSGGEPTTLVAASRDVLGEAITHVAGVTYYAMYGDSQVAVFQKPEGKPASRLLGGPFTVLEQVAVRDDAVFVVGFSTGVLRVARTCAVSEVTPVAGAAGYDDDFCFAPEASASAGRCDFFDGTKYVAGPSCAAGGTCRYEAGSAGPTCAPAPTSCEAVPSCGNVTCGPGCSCLNSSPSQCSCR